MIRDIIRFCVSLPLIAASAAFGSDGKTNVFFVHGANAVSAAYNPFVDGAMAEIKVFVVDAAGTPVKDATVSYAYNADTNQRYQSEIKLRHNYTYGKGVTESKKIDDGEYLIYRVRSQTNEFGRVTHAHYGRIDEKFSQVLGLSIRSAFNPTDNDTNLEGN